MILALAENSQPESRDVKSRRPSAVEARSHQLVVIEVTRFASTIAKRI